MPRKLSRVLVRNRGWVATRNLGLVGDRRKFKTEVAEFLEKNAHKSPFMLAQGETFDLPWIEAMNVHDAFLFSDNAF